MTVLVILVVIGAALLGMYLKGLGSRPALGSPREDSSARLPLAAITLRLPELPPELDRVVRVPSTKERGRIHEVNPCRVSCTCDGFLERRSAYEDRDVRRVCGHIAAALSDAGALPLLDEVTRSVIAYGAVRGKEKVPGVLDEEFVEGTLGASRVVLGLSWDREWVNVYTRRRKKGDTRGSYSGAYERYGFNLAEQRWSYGSPPPGAPELRALIATVVASSRTLPG